MAKGTGGSGRVGRQRTDPKGRTAEQVRSDFAATGRDPSEVIPLSELDFFYNITTMETDARGARKPPKAVRDAYWDAIAGGGFSEDLPLSSPLDKLVATQGVARARNVEKIRNRSTDGSRSFEPKFLPVVIRHKGKDYVADGHHRLIADFLDKRFPIVRVLEVPA
jgi:hypothetical protein